MTKARPGLNQHPSCLITGLLLWLCVLAPEFAFSQAEDSLERVFREAPNDSVRMRRMLDVGNRFRAANPIYSLKLATAVQKQASELKRRPELSQAENLLGMINELQGDYKTALTHYLRAYELIQEMNKPQFESTLLNNIAIIYEKFKLNEQALEYYQKALRIDSLLDDQVGITYTLLNLGFLNQQMDKRNASLNYYRKSMALAVALGIKEVEAALYHNLGELYKSSKQFRDAEAHYQRSLDLADSLKYYPGVVNTLLSLAQTKRLQSLPTQAMSLLNRAVQLARQQGLQEKLAEALRGLAELSAEQGAWKAANRYWSEYGLINDTVKDQESKRLTQELLFKFDVHQKNRAIDELNQLMRLQEESLERERQIRLGLLFGGGILLILLGLIYYQYRHKRKANRILQVQRKQLELQARDLVAAHNEALAYSNILEQVNEDMLKQHEVIEQQHRSLIDSLEYAYRIQQAMLPDLNEFQQAFTDSFVLYRPKAIVSGDFYWIHVSTERVLLAVVDCTGHGAPGAFMAVLGNSLLNQIILQEKIENPKLILDLLDQRVQAHLNHQRSRSTSPSSDGMELAICRIDRHRPELLFAGANRPLYLVRQNQMNEIRGSKAVISGHIGARSEEFAEHQIDLLPGDCLYLCSDGFADQLGGPELRRKYSTVRLKQQLASQAHQRMVQQKLELRRAINQWRGRLPFVDDVLIIGFRYPDLQK